MAIWSRCWLFNTNCSRVVRIQLDSVTSSRFPFLRYRTLGPVACVRFLLRWVESELRRVVVSLIFRPDVARLGQISVVRVRLTVSGIRNQSLLILNLLREAIIDISYRHLYMFHGEIIIKVRVADFTWRGRFWDVADFHGLSDCSTWQIIKANLSADTYACNSGWAGLDSGWSLSILLIASKDRLIDKQLPRSFFIHIQASTAFVIIDYILGHLFELLLVLAGHASSGQPVVLLLFWLVLTVSKHHLLRQLVEGAIRIRQKVC